MDKIAFITIDQAYPVGSTIRTTNENFKPDEVIGGEWEKIERNEAAYLLETYSNGSSWYRIWSDGWCEQSGRGTLDECKANVISLYKAYKDTNYATFISQNTVGTAGDSEMGAGINAASVDTIKVFCHYINPNSQTITWKTAGYLADDEWEKPEVKKIFEFVRIA